MKWVKTSSIISFALIIIYYISHWFLVPKLLLQPPVIAGEIGRFMWWTSLNKESQQIIKYTNFFLLFLVVAAFLSYIINLVLRIKYRRLDKWFIFLTILLLPALPSLLIIGFLRLLG